MDTGVSSYEKRSKLRLAQIFILTQDADQDG